MSRELMVFRCRACGDVFTSEEEEVRCPTCSSAAVELAREPLL